jgi:hypothetical protein
MHSDGCSQRKQSTSQAACSAERAQQRRSQRRASAAHRVCCREDRRACRQFNQHAINMQSACNQRRTGFAAARTAVRADNLISMQSACNQHAISMQSVAHRVCCREDRRACRQGADDACLGHLHARRVDDQHAISMQSTCNQHALSMQSVCNQHALSMHSACTHHEISMQSACNHRDRLLLHSLEERLVLSASHLIELVDAAAALSGRTRCNQHAISMQSACNQQQP